MKRYRKGTLAFLGPVCHWEGLKLINDNGPNNVIWIFFQLALGKKSGIRNLLTILAFLSVEDGVFRRQGYKTFSMLNSIEHGISNAHKCKNIEKSSFFQVQISLECYFSCS